MTIGSVIAFLQPGIQPGLKARSGENGAENPFAALMAALGGAPVAEAGAGAGAQAGTGKPANAGRPQEPGLPAPLRLLKEIGEAVADALAEGRPLPTAEDVPPQFQNLLEAIGALDADLKDGLESLIGTEATEALVQFAAAQTPATDEAPVSEDTPQIAGSTDTDPPAGTGEDPVAATDGETQADETPPPAILAEIAPSPAPPAPPPPAGVPLEAEARVQAPVSAPANAPRPPAADAGIDDQSPLPPAPQGRQDADAPDLPQPAAEPRAQRPVPPALPQAASAQANAATAAAFNQPLQALQAAKDGAKPQAVDDDASAQTPAREATRGGLRGLLETLAAGTRPETSASPAAREHAATPLAAAIEKALAARNAGQSATPAPDGANADALTASTARASDPILLAGDRPAHPAFAAAPPRSVTIPAYGASLPAAQIAMAISTQARAGTRHFDIRLDPPEMGRIDVRLEMGRDGVLNAQLTVDRPDTYDQLSRDARHLERMLQQAGMKLDGSSIQFSMRDGGGAQTGSGGRSFTEAPAQAPSGEAEAAMPPPVYARLPSNGLVDIEV